MYDLSDPRVTQQDVDNLYSQAVRELDSMDRRDRSHKVPVTEEEFNNLMDSLG